MANFFQKIRSYTKTMIFRVEKTQESITFAESGYPHLSDPDDSGMELQSGQLQVGKLLVIGHESNFSPTVIDYALEMAQRMSYEIVAMNTAPLSSNTIKLLSSDQKKICQEFQARSAEQVRSFRLAAEEQGLTFTHIVKFSDHDTAFEEIQRDFPDIEFVISDSTPETNTEQIADTQRPTNQVYVYSMI